MCSTSSKSICTIVLATAFIGTVCDFAPIPEIDVDGSLLEKMIGKRSLLDDITESPNVSEQTALRRLVLKHVAQIEPKMRPSLAILPSNEFGKFDSPAVRYVLHRFFAHQRGWRVEGLDPEGAAWNSSTADKVLALERLSKEGRARLARRIGHQGLTADDAITLGAAIEIFIHSEAIERLVKLFNVAGISSVSPISEEQAERGLECYMSCFIMGANLSETSWRKMNTIRKNIETRYPAWPKTNELIYAVAAKNFGITAGLAQNYGNASISNKELAQTSMMGFRNYGNISGSAFSSVRSVNFSQVSSAVEQITDRYGRWQNYECLDLKQYLVNMEDRGTGRVRLTDFYRVALGGKWQFTESVPYLRELGALDESNPNDLRVIIPNYVNAATNCVGSAKYGALCCISECWDVFEQIETALGVAMATPQDIKAVVAQIPSSTVLANRSLGALSAIRLRSIAASHGGVVPIHGRLFAQWLHHAYPRECNFPHRAGTTQPKDLYQKKFFQVTASKDDMKQHAAKNFYLGSPVENMAWSHDEELFVSPDHLPMHPAAWLKVQLFASCAAIFTMVMGLTRSARLSSRRSKVQPQVKQHSMVNHMSV